LAVRKRIFEKDFMKNEGKKTLLLKKFRLGLFTKGQWHYRDFNTPEELLKEFEDFKRKIFKEEELN